MDEILNMLPILWVASSKRDFLEMPDDVIDDFGFGLYQAQKGKHPKIGKILKGFGGASVIELVEIIQMEHFDLFIRSNSKFFGVILSYQFLLREPPLLLQFLKKFNITTFQTIPKPNLEFLQIFARLSI